MFTREDLIDAILARLGRPTEVTVEGVPLPRPCGRPTEVTVEGAPPSAASRRARGRAFLTEYDVKKTLTPGAQLLTIPQDAIVSPLAQEWLDLKGIAIVRRQ